MADQAGSTGLIKKYPHIIIDTQARPEPSELSDLVEGSDLLIVPTTPNHLDLDATLKAVDLLEPIKANYKILLTQVDSRTRSGREARKFFEQLNLPLFKVDIPRLVAKKRAPSRGVSISDYPDPRSRTAWSSISSVGREILPTSE